MFAMWEISKSKKLLDATAIYEGYPTFFSITLHHGGKFTKFPGRTYIDGKVDYVNFIDMDEFSVHELDYMMQQLGYEVPPVIYYHFQIPNGDFDFGLRDLGNDLDVLTLGKFIEDNKVIHVYTEHGETRLLTYFMSPRVKPRVVIEELDNVDAMDNLNHEKEGERLDLSLVLFRSPEYSKQRKSNHGEDSSSSRKRLCFNAQEDLNVQDEMIVSAPVNLSDDMDMEQNIQVPIVDPVDDVVDDAVDDANAQEIDEANEQDYTLHSWTWFLQCLQDDLDLYSNSNFTFISDRQKGILQAVSQVFPQAEHRFCLRHIHENMRKFWKTTEYKDHLWKCSAATTVPEFENCMTELSHFDRETFEWLKKIPPQHWARSHFSGRAGTDIVLNNLCEVFNSKLVQGRDKPIISCLEFIRQYLMKMICNVMKVMDKAQGPLTPTGSKLLEKNRLESVQYRARWNGTAKYEVYGPWHDQHVVDMGEMTCTCRKWELNGIPYKHAIATIHEMGDSGERVGELYTYVNKVYLLSTWREAYSYKVEPIKGRVMWPKSNCPFTLTPPPHHTQPGRPKVKRKRSADEKSLSQSQGKRLTRNFVSVRCRKCKNRGHNSRTCQG
ncbi:hypothetical protein LXL04_010239 [Taraxacum kok-saghyz]